jgi:hypothetical protein
MYIFIFVIFVVLFIFIPLFFIDLGWKGKEGLSNSCFSVSITKPINYFISVTNEKGTYSLCSILNLSFHLFPVFLPESRQLEIPFRKQGKRYP